MNSNQKSQVNTIKCENKETNSQEAKPPTREQQLAEWKLKKLIQKQQQKEISQKDQSDQPLRFEDILRSDVPFNQKKIPKESQKKKVVPPSHKQKTVNSQENKLDNINEFKNKSDNSVNSQKNIKPQTKNVLKKDSEPIKKTISTQKLSKKRKFKDFEQKQQNQTDLIDNSVKHQTKKVKINTDKLESQNEIVQQQNIESQAEFKNAFKGSCFKYEIIQLNSNQKEQYGAEKIIVPVRASSRGHQKTKKLSLHSFQKENQDTEINIEKMIENQQLVYIPNDIEEQLDPVDEEVREIKQYLSSAKQKKLYQNQINKFEELSQKEYSYVSDQQVSDINNNSPLQINQIKEISNSVEDNICDADAKETSNSENTTSNQKLINSNIKQVDINQNSDEADISENYTNNSNSKDYPQEIISEQEKNSNSEKVGYIQKNFEEQKYPDEEEKLNSEEVLREIQIEKIVDQNNGSKSKYALYELKQVSAEKLGVKFVVSPIKDFQKQEYKEAEQELKELREELGQEFGYIGNKMSAKFDLSTVFNNMER